VLHLKVFRFTMAFILALTLLIGTVAGAGAVVPANPMRTSAPPIPEDETADDPFGEEDPGEGDQEPDKDDPDWDLADNELTDVVFDIVEDPLALTGGLRNILLVGSDARPGQKTGRSDSIIILTLDSNQNQIQMTSIMRDTYVDIPGRGGNRINASFAYGGADLLIQTIEHNFGIRVDDYLAVDFSMLAALIDQIGGLTLNISSQRQLKAINDVIREDNRVLKKTLTDGFISHTGVQTLTGKQAQAYARYRKLDSDFYRTARQREVLTKCIEKARRMTVQEMSKLATGNIDKVYTNMTLGDVLTLLPAVLTLRDAEVLELRIPVDGGYSSRMIRGMSVLVPDIKKNRTALEEFINH